AYSRLSFTVTPCTYRAACRSWRVFRQVVDVADAEAFQHVAQPVHVDAEDAGLQLGALALLGGDPGAGGGQHLGRAGPGDAHHAVVVGDDHVARTYDLAAADDGDVDRAGAGLDGALRGDGARPDGEAHAAQRGDV